MKVELIVCWHFCREIGILKGFLTCSINILLKIEGKESLKLLIAGWRKDLQNMIADGCSLQWESYKLDPYVQRLADSVISFQEKVIIQKLIGNIITCCSILLYIEVFE